MKEASEEAKQEIKRLIQEGRVEFAGDVSRINLENPDFTITKAVLEFRWGWEGFVGFEISWETVSGGFGTVTFYKDKNGELCCENEDMSREFIKSVLNFMIDRVILDEHE